MPKEELDCVGDLRYCWRKLKRLAGEVGDRLAQLQPGFQRSLVAEVRAFVGDALAFRADWEAHGPTVPGLDPKEATDRLRKFQQLFEVRQARPCGSGHPTASCVFHTSPPKAGSTCALNAQRLPSVDVQARKRKWEGFTAGEALFGLPVTAFPELERTELEIVNLDKLYRYFNGPRPKASHLRMNITEGCVPNACCAVCTCWWCPRSGATATACGPRWLSGWTRWGSRSTTSRLSASACPR